MDYALPVLFAVGTWWLSTIVLLYRAGRPPETFPLTLAAVTAVMLLGIYGIVASRGSTSIAGTYLAFSSALAVWAWHEVSYLFGFVSGPRPSSCPPDSRGLRRFVLGLKTCLYHELAIVATAAVIAGITWQSGNRTALWTFVVLWLMRWSAKLNIFLGVANLHIEYWPAHLQYLKSYVRQRAMNGLFPWSVIASSAAIALLVTAAVNAGDDNAARASSMLLATLLSLALLEHGFLMLRVDDGVLWRAGLKSKDASEKQTASVQPADACAQLGKQNA